MREPSYRACYYRCCTKPVTFGVSALFLVPTHILGYRPSSRLPGYREFCSQHSAYTGLAAKSVPVKARPTPAWPRHIRCWPYRGLRTLDAWRAWAHNLYSRKGLNGVRSRIVIVGRWTAPDGVVHGRSLGSGKNHGPYAFGMRTLCGKPWKHPPSGPHCPEGLRRVDFLNFEGRITCDSCARSLDQVICGQLPKRADIEAA